ncbi:B3 domain-containing transcription factor VRN1-like isoform X3 [Telopea speciosissima]|uniref:B3 domain-containing transcription factor VRN1-like isoform X3 n=1 Tax=Telopea speciosissima TaxID=54955 RepID=UPI001CC4A002|nr:B3 domain-containing transcription factor VRN1-like isoform X3 [Telopea speciosissima]
MRRRRRIREGSRISSPKPHFFKIIAKASLESGELMIPKEFTRQYAKKIADVAVLKVPTGRKWEVEVKKVDGSVTFQNGWRGFLEYHSISIGHFLVFRYDGNSTFSVFIFHQGACEIDYPSDSEDDLEESNLHTECLIPVKEEPEEEDPVEPLWAFPSFQPLPSSTDEVLDNAQELRITKRGRGRPRKRSSARKQTRNRKHQELRELGDGSGLTGNKGKGPIFDAENEMEVIEISSDNSKNETSMFTATETSSLSMGDDAQHQNTDADNSLPFVPLPSCEEVSPQFNRSELSATAIREVESNCLEQECRSKEFTARNSTSAPEPDAGKHLDSKDEENVSMPSSQRYNRVVAASKRLVMYQQREKAISAAQMFKTKNPSVMIIMKPSYVYKGTNFPKIFAKKYLNYGLHNVKVSVSDGRTWILRCSIKERKAMISAGWSKFVRDNKLKEGDCCVFELSKAKGMELKISIFRVVEEAEPELKYNQ